MPARRPRRAASLHRGSIRGRGSSSGDTIAAGGGGEGGAAIPSGNQDIDRFETSNRCGPADKAMLQRSVRRSARRSPPAAVAAAQPPSRAAVLGNDGDPPTDGATVDDPPTDGATLQRRADISVGVRGSDCRNAPAAVAAAQASCAVSRGTDGAAADVALAVVDADPVSVSLQLRRSARAAVVDNEDNDPIYRDMPPLVDRDRSDAEDEQGEEEDDEEDDGEDVSAAAAILTNFWAEPASGE